MKALAFAFALLAPLAHAAEKKYEGPTLPAKSLSKDDPLSLDALLDPGEPVPEILPAPESLPDPRGTKPRTDSAKTDLIAAANDYRRKTELFRKAQINKDALRSSAIQVAIAAKAYRASLRR